MTPMRVVLADDHTLVRAGIRALLEQLLDVHVVAEASDGREAVYLVTTTRPNVALNQHLCYQGQSSVVTVREGNHDK